MKLTTDLHLVSTPRSLYLWLHYPLRRHGHMLEGQIKFYLTTRSFGSNSVFSGEFRGNI